MEIIGIQTHTIIHSRANNRMNGVHGEGFNSSVGLYVSPILYFLHPQVRIPGTPLTLFVILQLKLKQILLIFAAIKKYKEKMRH